MPGLNKHAPDVRYVGAWSRLRSPCARSGCARFAATRKRVGTNSCGSTTISASAPGSDGGLLEQPPRQQLSAVSIGSGSVAVQLGFSGAQADTEGAAPRRLLDQLRRPSRCLLADTLHTRPATAHKIRQLQPADAAGAGARRLPLGRSPHHAAQPQPRAHRDPHDPSLGCLRLPPVAGFHRRAAGVPHPARGGLPEGRPPSASRKPPTSSRACRVRKGALPRVLAALTNVTLTILRLLKVEGARAHSEELLPQAVAGRQHAAWLGQLRRQCVRTSIRQPPDRLRPCADVRLGRFPRANLPHSTLAAAPRFATSYAPSPLELEL